MNGRIRKLNPIGTMLAGLVLALLVAVPAAKADTYDPGDWAPMVWSDKADYAPGEHVTLNGAHWTPGETVHLRVNDDAGASWVRDVDVTADEAGGIVDEFNLPDWFVAQYRVTASDKSGAVATHTFTDGNVVFALATADQDAPANLSWSVDWKHYGDSVCGTQDGSGTASYSGNALNSGAQPAVGNKQSATPVSASATGYVLDYWSASPTSTTPLTGAALCTAEHQGTTTLYAHFNQAIQNTGLSVANATGTYGGTTNLSATLTAGAAGVSGKTIAFKLNGTTVGTATTTSSGVATLSNASLTGINAGSYPTGVSASFAGDGSYSGSNATGSLSVSQRSVTGSFTAADKVYDGTRDATITGRSLTGVVGTEDVTLSGGSAQFDTKDVGTDKTVTGSGFSLDGADKGNYALGSVADAEASITAKEVTGTFTAADKVYDGTRDATITSGSLSGAIDGDQVSLAAGTAQFDTKDVGTGKDVTGSGFGLAGTDKGNYTLKSSTLVAKASITAKELTGHFTAADKVYDGTRDATIIGRSLTGVLGSEDVSLSGGTATFTTPDVGQSKTVIGVGFALAGADSDNYVLASTTLTTTASITYRWDGFLQPINDTAHQTGAESKFKLGQTVPAKFVIKAASGAVVTQATSPTFTRSTSLGACDPNAVAENVVEDTAPSAGGTYGWDGSKYQYNWSTKGLTSGEYRIYANLADGSKRYVDVCLTK